VSRNRIPVLIGDVKVAGSDTVLFTIGLGSCVAIVLYDTERRVGGLAHAMLPDPSCARRPTPVGRFASTAVPELIALMQSAGATRSALRARLAGGASMFEALLTESGRRLGLRNVHAARTALAEAGIPVDGEDVGGGHGRSVYLHIEDGRVVVSSVLHADVVL
jgi:chemotaxis protein CheD